MSIGKRFFDLARAELNSLLDYAGRRGGGDEERDFDGGRDRGGDNLAGFSRRELEEELARRRSAYDEVEEAIHGRRSAAPRNGGDAQGEPGGPERRGNQTPGAARERSAPTGPASGGTSSATSSSGDTQTIRQAYATLEVGVGSDFEAVRSAYRRLMRKYHPDHHTSSPEAQRVANEIAQRLTEAYHLLQQRLDR